MLLTWKNKYGNKDRLKEILKNYRETTGNISVDAEMLLESVEENNTEISTDAVDGGE